MKTQYTPDGVYEMLDPTPIELPIGLKRPETLQETMARMLRQHFLIQKQNEGFESPEEADDFEIEDDGTPWSPYEDRADEEAKAIDLLKAEGAPSAAADGGEPAKPAEAKPASTPDMPST